MQLDLTTQNMSIQNSTERSEDIELAQAANIPTHDVEGIENQGFENDIQDCAEQNSEIETESSGVPMSKIDQNMQQAGKDQPASSISNDSSEMHYSQPELPQLQGLQTFPAPQIDGPQTMLVQVVWDKQNQKWMFLQNRQSPTLTAAGLPLNTRNQRLNNVQTDIDQYHVIRTPVAVRQSGYNDMSHLRQRCVFSHTQTTFHQRSLNSNTIETKAQVINAPDFKLPERSQTFMETLV